LVPNPSFIQGIYETHLEISDLERSVAFYETLGLTLGLKHGRGAFFWVSRPGEQMLGLWLTKEGQAVNKRSFAFQTTLENVLQAGEWLSGKNIPLSPVFGRQPTEPIVHPWMPAATVYFHDPDGNELKLLALLQEEPVQMPGVLYYSEWRKLVEDRNP